MFSFFIYLKSIGSQRWPFFVTLSFSLSHSLLLLSWLHLGFLAFCGVFLSVARFSSFKLLLIYFFLQLCLVSWLIRIKMHTQLLRLFTTKKAWVGWAGWLSEWVSDEDKKCLSQTRNNGWQIEINCYRTQGYLSNCELTQVSNWSENIQTESRTCISQATNCHCNVCNTTHDTQMPNTRLTHKHTCPRFDLAPFHPGSVLCICTIWFYIVCLLSMRPTYCWMLYVFIKLQQFHPICSNTQPDSNPIVALMRLLTVSFSHRIHLVRLDFQPLQTLCREFL